MKHVISLADRTRDELATNSLPPAIPLRAWAGTGDGELCAGCDAAIDPVHPMRELEFADGITIRVHVACEKIWRAETGH